MNKNITKELIKTRKAIKEKYQALKSLASVEQAQLERNYEPLTKPLNELVSTLAKVEPTIIKEEPSNYTFLTPKKEKKIFSTPKKEKKVTEPVLPTEVPSFLDESISNISQIQNLETTFETTPTPEQNTSDEAFEETIQNLNLSDIINQTKSAIQKYVGTEAYKEWLDGFDELPRNYIDEGVKDTEHNFDHVYGIIHDIDTEKFHLGMTGVPLELDGKDIKIQGLLYKGTPGLYELLFKKQPIGYKPEDLDNYMDILARTNAYRRHNDPAEQVQGNSSLKYITIIKPYLQDQGITKSKNPVKFERPTAPYRMKKKIGKNLVMKLNRPNTDYIYYNEYNELVERLKLLIASVGAGHTGHNNEIISIIEELKEAKIIE